MNFSEVVVHLIPAPTYRPEAWEVLIMVSGLGYFHGYGSRPGLALDRAWLTMLDCIPGPAARELEQCLVVALALRARWRAIQRAVVRRVERQKRLNAAENALLLAA